MTSCPVHACSIAESVIWANGPNGYWFIQRRLGYLHARGCLCGSSTSCPVHARGIAENVMFGLMAPIGTTVNSTLPWIFTCLKMPLWIIDFLSSPCSRYRGKRYVSANGPNRYYCRFDVALDIYMREEAIGDNQLPIQSMLAVSRKTLLAVPRKTLCLGKWPQ